MSPARMMPISRRTLLRTAAAAVVPMRPARAQSPAALLDDASRLNAVPIARHWRRRR